jgi:hypothetical protein
VLLAEYQAFLKQRRDALVPVTEPLVLITQMARSGGTLTMRLLDGHPELHPLPHEFRSNFGPDGALLRDLETAWHVLSDPSVEGYARRGIRQARSDLNRDTGKQPLLISPAFQREIFDRLYAADGSTERGAINAYFTAYFNSVLDYRNLVGVAEKRWVTAFAPHLVRHARPMGRFTQLYPDGVIVSVIRHPATWWPSARRWSDRWARLDRALALWSDAAKHTIALKRLLGDRLYVISFEELLGEPEQTMRALAAYLGIAFQDSLLQPTMNGIPMRANSSYATRRVEISTDPLDRGASLEPADLATIERRAVPLYERVLALRDGNARAPGVGTPKRRRPSKPLSKLRVRSETPVAGVTKNGKPKAPKTKVKMKLKAPRVKEPKVKDPG